MARVRCADRWVASMVWLVAAVVLPLVVGGVIVAARHWHRQREMVFDLTPVTRQHLELYQGGQLNDDQLQAAKQRYRELFERGEIDRIEATLRPGMLYVVKVRALAEIGTEEACQILERQLHRKLSTNPIEQAWYWIDLANSLRALGRDESLPHLLDCVHESDDFPLIHHFAAETVCFVSFHGYLRELDTSAGRSALKLLHRAVEGLRYGIQPQLVIESRLGELIETLWDNKPARPDPRLVRLFVELKRHLRRAEHTAEHLEEDPFEREAFHLQHARLLALEDAVDDYLSEAGPYLLRQLRRGGAESTKEVLEALNDLRYDAGKTLLLLLKDSHFPYLDLAVNGLRWSRDPEVPIFLRNWAIEAVQPHQRGMRPLKAWAPSRASVPDEFPYANLLRTLRAFPSVANEQFLLTAAHDWDPTFRAAAISSLCWWEPFSRAEVVLHLQDARFDPSGEVRHHARAALARLGERQALQWFRQALQSENKSVAMDAIQAIAQEDLTLLWPDLDRVVDLDEPDLSFFAREALEQLREEMEYRQTR